MVSNPNEFEILIYYNVVLIIDKSILLDLPTVLPSACYSESYLPLQLSE